MRECGAHYMFVISNADANMFVSILNFSVIFYEHVVKSEIPNWLLIDYLRMLSRLKYSNWVLLYI